MSDDLNARLRAMEERLRKLERRSAVQDTQDVPGNFTAGAVAFGNSAGKLTQDATNLLWNDASDYLQIPTLRLNGQAYSFYDEGSYTPTYTGATTAGATTYSTQTGWYWRFGPLLFVTGLVVWTAATGTGNAQISLPFAIDASKPRASGAIRITSVTFTTTTPEVLVSSSSALFTMESPASNAAGNVVQMEAAGNITFSLFYPIVP